MKENIDWRDKLRILAGITQDDTLATLTIPKVEGKIQLKHIPTWFERLKYNICGFECKILRREPYTHPQDVVNANMVEFEN